jgi:hypothetical protein
MVHARRRLSRGARARAEGVRAKDAQSWHWQLFSDFPASAPTVS